MLYTRGLSIAATVALSGYLFKSYRTKNEEKEKNNFLQIHNQNHDLYCRKNLHLPTLISNKSAKINKNSHNSIQDKWWENVFKLKADEDNPDAVNQSPQTPWGYLESIAHDVKVKNQFREIARSLLTSHAFLRRVEMDESVILNNLQQKELRNQNVYGLQEAKNTLENLQENRKNMESQLINAINAFHALHSTKQNYSQLKEVIKRLDQNLSVLRQKLTETFTKEQLVYDDSGIELSFDNYDYDDDDDPNDAAAVNRNIPLRRFADPKLDYVHVLQYDDFTVEYTRRNRVPTACQEVVTHKNIGEIEHRHWQLISIVPKVPTALQANIDVCENNEFDVVRVGCGDLFPEPAASNNDIEQPVCEVCQNTPFWPLFHCYVKFLVDMYGYVNVFSGALYRPNPIPGKHTYEQNYAALTPDDRPTHFYKCIFVDYYNGTCRFECYLVPNKCMKDEKPDLKDYLVNKEMLERRITSDFNFEDRIIDCTPHKFFDHI